MRSRAPGTIHPRRVGSSYMFSGLVECCRCKTLLSDQDARRGRFSCCVRQSLIKLGGGGCDTPRLNARRFERLIVGRIRPSILAKDGDDDAKSVVVKELARVGCGWRPIAGTASRRCRVRWSLASGAGVGDRQNRLRIDCHALSSCRIKLPDDPRVLGYDHPNQRRFGSAGKLVDIIPTRHPFQQTHPSIRRFSSQCLLAERVSVGCHGDISKTLPLSIGSIGWLGSAATMAARVIIAATAFSKNWVSPWSSD